MAKAKKFRGSRANASKSVPSSSGRATQSAPSSSGRAGATTSTKVTIRNPNASAAVGRPVNNGSQYMSNLPARSDFANGRTLASRKAEIKRVTGVNVGNYRGAKTEFDQTRGQVLANGGIPRDIQPFHRRAPVASVGAQRVVNPQRVGTGGLVSSYQGTGRERSLPSPILSMGEEIPASGQFSNQNGYANGYESIIGTPIARPNFSQVQQQGLSTSSSSFSQNTGSQRPSSTAYKGGDLSQYSFVGPNSNQVKTPQQRYVPSPTLPPSQVPAVLSLQPTVSPGSQVPSTRPADPSFLGAAQQQGAITAQSPQQTDYQSVGQFGEEGGFYDKQYQIAAQQKALQLRSIDSNRSRLERDYESRANYLDDQYKYESEIIQRQISEYKQAEMTKLRASGFIQTDGQGRPIPGQEAVIDDLNQRAERLYGEKLRGLDRNYESARLSLDASFEDNMMDYENRALEVDNNFSIFQRDLLRSNYDDTQSSAAQLREEQLAMAKLINQREIQEIKNQGTYQNAIVGAGSRAYVAEQNNARAVSVASMNNENKRYIEYLQTQEDLRERVIKDGMSPYAAALAEGDFYQQTYGELPSQEWIQSRTQYYSGGAGGSVGNSFDDEPAIDYTSQ